jgi:hypothetical protein
MNNCKICGKVPVIRIYKYNDNYNKEGYIKCESCNITVTQTGGTCAHQQKFLSDETVRELLINKWNKLM